jgi:hypothetical protein
MGSPKMPNVPWPWLQLRPPGPGLPLKRKRGRPRLTLLGAKSRHWKKKHPPKRPRGRLPWTLETKALLVEVLAERMLEGATSWEVAAKQLVAEGILTRSIKVASLVRQARAARRDPRVRALVIARLPAAAQFLPPLSG